MNKKFHHQTWLVAILLLLSGAVLTGCNLTNRGADETPTLDTTQAYQTVQARLTEAIALTPTQTMTLTPSPSPTVTRTPSPSPTAGTATVAVVSPTSSGGSGTSSCDQASPGSPIDVTIPDDTNMQPGQSFSKTWRLRNAGTCTWNSSYSIVYFSGERMGAPDSVPLTGSVPPGQTVDVTVDMVAPTTAGTFQSNWKMRNASNQLFGIGPGEGLPFYVRIIVATNVTVTPTTSTTPATPTATTPAGTAQVTPTSTSEVGVSGSAILFPADRLDLDSIQVNSGSADLLYQRSDNDNRLYLAPLDSTAMAVYGSFVPSQGDCAAANLGASPLDVESLAIGSYVCHRSGSGNLGWMRLVGFNADNGRLDLDVYTWTTR